MNVDVHYYAEDKMVGGRGGGSKWGSAGESGMGVEVSEMEVGLRDVEVSENLNAKLLHSACVGDVETVHKCMSEGYCDVDQADNLGRTALHWAVERGHGAVVEVLVTQYHASLDVLTNDSDSPLMLAILSNRLDIVQLLLSYGAYMQHTNKEGASALHLAAAQGDAAIVRALVSHGAWLELEDAEGESPLFYAIREAHLEVVKALLEAGASPAHPNNDQETPLSLARECISPSDPTSSSILSLLASHSSQAPLRQNLLEPFTRVEARSFGSSSGNLCGFLTKTI